MDVRAANRLDYRWRSRPMFWWYSVRISVGTPVILTEGFRGMPHPPGKYINLVPTASFQILSSSSFIRRYIGSTLKALLNKRQRHSERKRRNRDGDINKNTKTGWKNKERNKGKREDKNKNEKNEVRQEKDKEKVQRELMKEEQKTKRKTKTK
jgi:hypothetical protein